MNAWDEFVGSLTQDIDWERYPNKDMALVESLLLRIHNSPTSIGEELVKLCKDERRLAHLAQHIEYPRPFMDKFVVHMDPNDRFRIRLHRFRPGTLPGLDGLSPNIHSHRWDYSRVVLRGQYLEKVFKFTKANPEPELVSETTALEGDVVTRAAGSFHQTINLSPTTECVTLFVRGPSRLKYSNVWDQPTKRLRKIGGRLDSIGSQLGRIAESLSTKDSRAHIRPDWFS